ncbi:MAG: exosortase/archaeosortase family protein [Burkholderiaceae bacterium]
MRSSNTLNDDDAHPTSSIFHRHALIFQAIFFLFAFMLLQGLWLAARDTWIERFSVNTVTVKTAVTLINSLTSEVGAIAIENRIDAPGGGITIANGCEGTDALFLLVAAIAACPFSWRVRVVGLLTGSFLVLALNQIRIITLFYAFRNDKALFGLLHHTVAPIALIAAASLFFLAWSTHHSRRCADV